METRLFYTETLTFVSRLQKIASLKRQFAELLSDIGFVKKGLRARVIERMSSKGADGVLEATGPEVKQTHAEMLL